LSYEFPVFVNKDVFACDPEDSTPVFFRLQMYINKAGGANEKTINKSLT